jgi:hypothetical protein
MSATGHWNLIIKTPMGEQKIEADLSEEAGALTGTMHDQNHPVAPIKESSVEGSRLGWKYDVRKPFATSLVFNVAVEGDSMTGTCKAGMFPAAKVTGARG